jgi:uncharacterized protein
MNIKQLVLIVLLLALIVNPVYANDLQDGMMAYIRGDYTIAFNKLKPLSEKGNASAQFYLGNMYDFERGVPRNDKEAVKWFRLSADQGFSLGQYNLGVMYTNGQGVSVNYLLAYKWFNLSAANGNENANFYRNKLEEVMSQSQIKKAQEMARNWKPETR